MYTALVIIECSLSSIVDHRTVNSEGLWFDLSKRSQTFPSFSICDKLTTCVFVNNGTQNLLYVTLRGIQGIRGTYAHGTLAR